MFNTARHVICFQINGEEITDGFAKKYGITVENTRREVLVIAPFGLIVAFDGDRRMSARLTKNYEGKVGVVGWLVEFWDIA